MPSSADTAFAAHLNVEAVSTDGRASRRVYFSLPIDCLGLFLIGGKVLDQYEHFNGCRPVVPERFLPDHTSNEVSGLYYKMRSNGKVVRGMSLKCRCTTYLSLEEVRRAHEEYLRQTGTTCYALDVAINIMETVSHHEGLEPRLVWWLELRS